MELSKMTTTTEQEEILDVEEQKILRKQISMEEILIEKDYQLSYFQDEISDLFESICDEYRKDGFLNETTFSQFFNLIENCFFINTHLFHNQHNEDDSDCSSDEL
jgi:hypothetical protein